MVSRLCPVSSASRRDVTCLDSFLAPYGSMRVSVWFQWPISGSGGGSRSRSRPALTLAVSNGRRLGAIHAARRLYLVDLDQDEEQDEEQDDEQDKEEPNEE